MAGTRSAAMTLAGLGIIWVAVVVISLFAPDLISGSEQEHLPIAALTSWVAGVIGTGAVVKTMRSARQAGDRFGPLVLGSVAVIWVVATLVALLAPDLVTGSDPTRLPIAAIVAPFAAAALTWVVGVVIADFQED